MIEYTPAERLDCVAAAAAEQCEEPRFSFLTAHDLPLHVVDDDFVTAYEEEAIKWLSDPAPTDLYFSHGEYFRGERGVDYVLSELNRAGSRRALLSLVGMDPFLEARDEPLPSFMVLQFAIDGDALYATAYFRALEVASFLPSNLAEIALHCRRIRAVFGRLSRLRLAIFAFRAYADPEFRLAKAEIDIQAAGEVAVTAVQRDIGRVRRLVEGKMRPETKAVTRGLEELVAGAEAAEPAYPGRFVEEVRAAIRKLTELDVLRAAHSESAAIDGAQAAYLRHLGAALTEIESA